VASNAVLMKLINLSAMSSNVPAVYEVLGARISKHKGGQSILTPTLCLQGTQNLGGVSRGSEPEGRPT
jgi:hypothetical protein